MKFLLILSLLFSIKCSAQNSPGTIQQALGGTRQHTLELASLFINPSTISELQKFNVEAQISNLYSLPEYSNINFSMALQNKAATFALQVTRSNFHALGSSLSLVAGKELKNEWQIGAGIKLEEGNNKVTPTILIGTSCKVNSELSLYSYIHQNDPFQSGEAYNTKYQGALCAEYKLTETSNMFTEYYLSAIEQAASIGLVFRQPSILLIIGIGVNQATISSGIKHIRGHKSFSASGSYHPILGFSPSISYAYSK